MTEIEICLGSSCFSRGNKKTVKIIQQYIKDNMLEGEVSFKGSHCFGQCDKGPMLRIGETVYSQVDENNIMAILDASFNIRTKEKS